MFSFIWLHLKMDKKLEKSAEVLVRNTITPKCCTYNATLCNGFIIALELYQACGHVEVTRIFYCQSHITVLPEQLEHEVISHICYGLEKKTIYSTKETRNSKTNCPRGIFATISYCCIASSNFSSLNNAFPSIFLLSAELILSSTVMSLRAFPYRRFQPLKLLTFLHQSNSQNVQAHLHQPNS